MMNSSLDGWCFSRRTLRRGRMITCRARAARCTRKPSPRPLQGWHSPKPASKFSLSTVAIKTYSHSILTLTRYFLYLLCTLWTFTVLTFCTKKRHWHHFTSYDIYFRRVKFLRRQPVHFLFDWAEIYHFVLTVQSFYSFW